MELEALIGGQVGEVGLVVFESEGVGGVEKLVLDVHVGPVVVAFAYGEAGQLLTVTYPGGEVVTTTYDTTTGTAKYGLATKVDDAR